ncbi:2-amino-4-hydroxy-6-hydroxymethyldihydropteridine diphosphokinase [Carboxylicivirga caseinilyticus]|uniref:2-amino-4-hydroxy-6- hydroxymethyldihydropteridine diphosphokinase n=1 Tax=Carboxylicivirga caseinilyticus TaxID=3417572 RepID=UPI003D340535|nr:2-amino-4-hydroxy-6-hydroxymethyldihydropteridine diphosphokinase [Marinilabiliaceae bacterium A049]
MIKYNKAILLLGGNIGNTKEYLAKAIKLLTSELCNPCKVSNLYESEPWGFESSQNFINQVVEFDTSKDPITLLDTTQKIEKALGRKEKTGTQYESRPIDIDILFIDNVIFQSERLIIPHKLLHERRFTLLPLSDHWNNLIHPVFNKTIDQLLLECNDKSIVKKIV